MRNIALTAATAALLLATTVHAEDAKQPDKAKAQKDYVIMKVNGDEIKRSEVEDVWKGIFPGGTPPNFDTFEEKIKDNVLRGVASEHVVEKEADKSGIRSSDLVKERIANAEKQILIQEFLKQKSRELVTEDQLKAAYAERTKGSEEEAHARHILVKTEEEAKEIEKKLKKGGDFAKLAKEKSEDKSSGANGGDLGWFTADKMVPEFSKAAFALKKGETSVPVKSDFGWHVIQLEDRRKVTPPTFEQMKDHLTQELSNKSPYMIKTANPGTCP
jgi:peptidyl-prolyl cis-trans isomerase C